MRKSVSLSVSFRDGPEITQGQWILGVRESRVLRFKRCSKVRNWLIFEPWGDDFLSPSGWCFPAIPPRHKVGESPNGVAIFLRIRRSQRNYKASYIKCPFTPHSPIARITLTTEP